MTQLPKPWKVIVNCGFPGKAYLKLSLSPAPIYFLFIELRTKDLITIKV